MNKRQWATSYMANIVSSPVTGIILTSCLLLGQGGLPVQATEQQKKTNKPAQTTDKIRKNENTDDVNNSNTNETKSVSSKQQDNEKKSQIKTETEPVIENIISVEPEDLVNKPQEFLGKNIKMTAHFFAFSNLALDYKPAYRSSRTYIALLITRSNSHVPLSELKLAMVVPPEKDPKTLLLSNLKEGDQLEIVGKVFSTALDDPWVDVLKLKKLNKDKDEDKTAQGQPKSTPEEMKTSTDKQPSK